MKQTDLQTGKRYWFRDREYVYSGIYDGIEISKNGKVTWARLVRKNGDVWIIPFENVFNTKDECTKGFKLKHLTIIG